MTDLELSSELVPIEKCKKCWELSDAIEGKGVYLCMHKRKMITRYWSPITGEYTND